MSSLPRRLGVSEWRANILKNNLRGSIPAPVDKNGETAMHGAAYKHVPTVVKYLAERGARADVWNRPNSKGWTPLKITEGVQRGMNIVSSPATAAAVREVLASSPPE